MENYELAERDYVSGMKYKEIAEKYGVSINTVKSWKTRYQWIRGPGNSKDTQKSVHTNKKSMHTQKEYAPPETSELTEQQKLFCVYFSRSHNATRSYMKAFNAKYGTAHVCAFRLLNKESIQYYLEELRMQQYRKIHLTEEDIIQRYAEIAFADPLDYVDKDGVMIRDLEDGSLISQVVPSKDGAKVVMADKMKALEKLQQYIEKKDAEGQIEGEEANSIVIAPRIKHGDMDTAAETI